MFPLSLRTWGGKVASGSTLLGIVLNVTARVGFGASGGSCGGCVRILRPVLSLTNFRWLSEEALENFVPEGGKFTRLRRKGGRHLGDLKPGKTSAHRYRVLDGLRQEVPCGEWGVFDIKERGSQPWDVVGHVHACHKVKSKVVVVFSPREGHGHPQLWAFDLNTGNWTEIKQEGVAPFWVEFPCTFIYSGRLWYLDYMKLRDRVAHVFSLHRMEWERLELAGEPPGGGKNREYVCVCSCYHKHFVYFYGGKPRERHVHKLDVREFVWEKRKSIADPPNPANTHSMYVYDNYLCVVTQRKTLLKRNVSLFTMELGTDDWNMEKRLVEVGRLHRMPDPIVLGNKWYWLEGKHELSVFEFDFSTYEPLEVSPTNGYLRGSKYTKACIIEPGVLLLLGWSPPRPPDNNPQTPYEFFQRSPFVQALVMSHDKNTEDAVSEGLTHDIASAFDDSLTSDVVLRVKDTEIAAHKTILASRSQVFREMFYGVADDSVEENVKVTQSKRHQKAGKQRKHAREGLVEEPQVVELDTRTHTPKAVLHVIKAIYGRLEECPTIWNELVDLTEAAGHYGVTGLGALCAETMEKTLDKESVWEAVQFSQDLKSESLWIACRDFAESHWHEVKSAKNRRRLTATDRELVERFLEGLSLPDTKEEAAPPLTEIPPRALVDKPHFID